MRIKTMGLYVFLTFCMIIARNGDVVPWQPVIQLKRHAKWHQADKE
jgi:hypothetical protein